ncbi:MAG: DUF5067 domain-containing protein [Tannerella sp.]|jgi:flagellar basal body-associated protein FliL|nr:DUF5067 domain-containing protein [Tannerella sp.]
MNREQITKEKKSFYKQVWFWIVNGIMVGIVLIIIVGLNSATETTETSETATLRTIESEPSNAKTTASKKEVDLIINRAEVYTNDSSVIKPDPGKKFVKVIFTITNNNKKNPYDENYIFTLENLDFLLVVEGERIHALMAFFDDTDKAANPDYLSNELEFPIGATYTKSLLFEVPENATAGTLRCMAEAKVNFSGSGDDKNETTTHTIPRKTSSHATASKKEVDLIINSTEKYSNYESNIQPKPGKKFVKVVFTITNNNKKIKGIVEDYDPVIGSLYFLLEVGDEIIDAKMTLFDDADKAANPDYLSNTFEFPIGATYTKSLLFEVPENATAGTFKHTGHPYHTYYYESEVEVEAEAKVNF